MFDYSQKNKFHSFPILYATKIKTTYYRNLCSCWSGNSFLLLMEAISEVSDYLSLQIIGIN